ncbi:MAG: DNA repair protein RecO [Bacilli bacterium]
MVKRESKSIRGLVLSFVPFKDDSAIVTVATDNGVTSFLASGIYKPKSPLKPMLLSFSFLEIEYKEGRILQATYAKCIFDSSVFFTDYRSNIFLSWLQELSLLLFNEGDSFPLKDYLSVLSAFQNKCDLLSISILLLGSIYKTLGLKIKTNSCYRCGANNELVSYSLQGGGFLCKKCSETLQYPPKSEMNLFILKFAFMDIESKTLSKIVPKKEGKIILTDLLDNLMSYFDIKKLVSLPLFLEVL